MFVYKMQQNVELVNVEFYWGGRSGGRGVVGGFGLCCIQFCFIPPPKARGNMEMVSFRPPFLPSEIVTIFGRNITPKVIEEAL